MFTVAQTWNFHHERLDRKIYYRFKVHILIAIINKCKHKYIRIYRSKVEKEFTENPLIKNLGITIYGSVHEARQREIAERKVSIHIFVYRAIIRLYCGLHWFSAAIILLSPHMCICYMCLLTRAIYLCCSSGLYSACIFWIHGIISTVYMHSRIYCDCTAADISVYIAV